MYMKNLEQELKENAYRAVELPLAKARTARQQLPLILSWDVAPTAATVYL